MATVNSSDDGRSNDGEGARALEAAGLSFDELLAVLRREDAARRSEAMQLEYAAVEARGEDWMGATRELQRRLLRSAGVPRERMAAALHLLRSAAQLFGAEALGEALPLYVRHNLASSGALRQGSTIPANDICLHPIDGEIALPLASVLAGASPVHSGTSRGLPTLLVAGSWT